MGWIQEYQQTFDQRKMHPPTASVLAHADLNKAFMLYTHAVKEQPDILVYLQELVYKASPQYGLIDFSILDCADTSTLSLSCAPYRHLEYIAKSYHINYGSASPPTVGFVQRIEQA
jgi:hypothetical protein